MVVVTLSLVLITTGCSLFQSSSAPDGVGEAYFDTDRVYVHRLASSQEECDSLNDQGINCLQFLELFTDGGAEIMITDIVHIGTYIIEGTSSIIVTVDPNPELPGSLQFAILENGIKLQDNWSNSIWELEE
jgi:hypothetical protein